MTWLDRMLRRAAIACATLSLSVLATAQTKVSFDPTRDLDGFEDCMRSEFKDLYPLARYDALLGKEISAAELDKLKQDWKSEVEHTTKAIALLRAEPLGVYLHHLYRRLVTDPYFTKISWTEDHSVPPFVFVVQKPAKEDPEYAKRMIASYAPWAQKLAQVIDALYVKPLALERRADPAAFALCILASNGDYINYSRTASSDFVKVGSALQMAVGYEDPFDTSASDTRKRYPLLFHVARMILDAYAADGASFSVWMASGLPAYLAYHEGLVPDTLDQRRIDDEGLALLVEALQKRERRSVLLHPLEDLLDIDDSESLVKLVQKRAADARLKEPAWNELLQALRIQSVMWMHFLQDAENGKYRARFLKYLKSELEGQRGLASFKRAFEGVDLVALDREFYAFVLTERERLHPTQKLDRAVLDTLFADRTEKPGANEEADGTAGGTAGVAAGAAAKTASFKPITLAIDAKDFAAQHGLALLGAQHGDLEGARKRLQELAAAGPPAPEDVRIARDVDRLAELVLLRDGWLANMAQTGAKWSSELHGKKFIAKIERVDKGRVHLGENKAGISEIPLSELDPAEIAKLADKKEKMGSAAPWSRAYAYILCGDARWEKLTRDTSPAGRELYQDAKAWYPELLRNGEAARLIDAIASMTLPRTCAEGQKVSVSLRALLAAAGDAPIVQARIEKLRAFASIAAETCFVADDVAALLHGAVTPIENGRVKIVYDFKKADQALDFVKDPGYMKDWGKSYADVKLDEAKSSFTISDGMFVGQGRTCYRHKLAFSGPITLRCTFRWRDVPMDNAAGSALMIGLCDDHKESYIACGGSGYILVSDRATGYSKQSTGGTSEMFSLGQTYHLDVQNDGSTVTTFVDDVQRRQASTGPRKSGDVFLWVHCDYPLDIERLDIEGAIEPSSIQRIKADWVARKVAELGFK